MAKFLLPLVLILSLAGCGGVSENTDKAEKIVDRIHQNYNNGNYNRIYKDSGKEYKDNVKADFNEKLFKTIQKKLGDVKSSKKLGWNYNTNTNGTFVTLTYDTKFELGNGREIFTFKVADEKIKMVGYNINSPALLIDLED